MIKNKRALSILGLVFAFLFQTNAASAISDLSFVSHKKVKGAFGLAVNGKAAPIVYGSNDFAGVLRAIKNLQNDIKLVTKSQSLASADKFPQAKELVIIGTIGKSTVIDRLIKEKRIDASSIAGRWEASLTTIVLNPMKGVEKALVIAGSDKRGTIFGIYELSAQIGVSPWSWWADVPVVESPNLYVEPIMHIDAPAVKYRGIFINDEAPALSGWSKEKFGGFNHKFYEKVFELILRLKGNYLWPAMWGSAFNDDDPENPRIADEMGVVMGTSHHEPLMRAHAEWGRYGKGAWNYSTNTDSLKDFWSTGIKRMGSYESIVTIGMRGDGDEPMSRESNISLLEKIVKDQREIIEQQTGKPAAETPQIWALYKEVQDYYDRGMRVPDDVTLLLCDDNWGNIRKLPNLNEKTRKGGYGIYYHFDYVGGPRNYKWLNTNPISKVWEQMHLAREYGADRLWLVNVGDIKPMEFPTEFFLDFAWNPEKWPAERLQEYTRIWVEKQFGPKYAAEIADIISLYTKYNGRRKPELLDQNTYSLSNYQEFETVVNEYNELAVWAEKIKNALPTKYHDAYFQLVLHPVIACANLYELYFTSAKNRLYAKQGRANTNDLAEKVKALFKKDSEISNRYNKEIANGKWNHMMDQVHIGYTSWQQPNRNIMPAVQEITIPEAAGFGIAIEESENWWPNSKQEAVLPGFNSYLPKSYYIEIFNRGKMSLNYELKSSEDWLKLSSAGGNLDKQDRIWVSVDWAKAPKGNSKASITISSNGAEVTVFANLNKPEVTAYASTSSFIEENGYLSIEAANFTRAVAGDFVQWKVLPDYGRTSSAVATYPVTTPSSDILKNDSPHLEYQMLLFTKGDIKIHTYLSPTINFSNSKGLRYAISIDDEAPQMVNLHEKESDRSWEKSVAENIKIMTTTHKVISTGKHVLKFWRVDPGVVLQKIVIDAGNLKRSYLGPPESLAAKEKENIVN